MNAPPRLPRVVKAAIRHRLEGQHRTTAVPVSRILKDVRAEITALEVSDEELIRQIVIDATDHGLAVHFDHDGEGR